MCIRDSRGEAQVRMNEHSRDSTEENIDDLLDEVDNVLEENAEEFVRNYVQAGGNGGGQYLVLAERIADTFGIEALHRLLGLLSDRNYYRREEELIDAIELHVGLDVGEYIDNFSSLHQDEFRDVVFQYLSDDMFRRQPLNEPERETLEQLGEREGSLLEREKEVRRLLWDGDAHAAEALKFLISQSPRHTQERLAAEFRFLIDDAGVHSGGPLTCGVSA